MKTKTTYLFLLLMTMVLGLQSCKDDKVDGAVFTTKWTERFSRSALTDKNRQASRSATDRHSSWRSFTPIRDGACQATNPGVPCQMYQATRLTNNTLKSR